MEDVEFMLHTVYLVALGLGGGWLAIAGLFSALGSAETDIDGKDFDLDEDIAVDVGADIDSDADGTGHAHGEATGVSWLSPLVVAATLFGFGITGFGVDSILGNVAIAPPLAVAVGVGSGWSLRAGLTALRRVAGSSHTERRRIVGSRGEVITSIPAGGVGQIALVCRGQRVNSPARARGGVAIPRGARVFVSRVDGPTFEVEQAREDRAVSRAAEADAARLPT